MQVPTSFWWALLQDDLNTCYVEFRLQENKTMQYFSLKNLNVTYVIETKKTLFEGPILYVQTDQHYISRQKQQTKGKFMVKQAALFDYFERVCQDLID